MNGLGLTASNRKTKTIRNSYKMPHIEHIGRLARMSVLDKEVDGSNPGSSMLFP